MTSYN